MSPGGLFSGATGASLPAALAGCEAAGELEAGFVGLVLATGFFTEPPQPAARTATTIIPINGMSRFLPVSHFVISVSFICIRDLLRQDKSMSSGTFFIP
jgi:hypothetical protein